MPYKLVISNRVEFPVRFSVRDGATDRSFAITAQCNRVDVEEFRKSLTTSEKTLGKEIADYLASEPVGLRMLAWVGDPLLVDENGVGAPAGPEALADLLKLDGMLQNVFAALADANSAKGKLGN